MNSSHICFPSSLADKWFLSATVSTMTKVFRKICFVTIPLVDLGILKNLRCESVHNHSFGRFHQLLQLVVFTVLLSTELYSNAIFFGTYTHVHTIG